MLDPTVMLGGLLIVLTLALVWALLAWMALGRHQIKILDRVMKTAAYGGDRTAVEDELAAHKREEAHAQRRYMVVMIAWLVVLNALGIEQGSVPWISLVTLVGWIGFCIWRW